MALEMTLEKVLGWTSIKKEQVKEVEFLKGGKKAILVLKNGLRISLCWSGVKEASIEKAEKIGPSDNKGPSFFLLFCYNLKYDHSIS